MAAAEETEKQMIYLQIISEERGKQMKKTWKILTAVLLSAAMLCMAAGCGKKETSENLWENAKYTEDTELGEGSKMLKVVVEAEDKKVTFTIASDAEMVGEALAENELIAGEEGEYGLYIKEVNGITADYDTDQAYWGFYKDGEYMMTSADMTPFADGEQYELVYTKE